MMFRMLLLLLICLMLVSCATHESGWTRNAGAAGVGQYTMPPAGYEKNTLGVMEFKDKTGGRGRGEAAADQIVTLWVKSRRFNVIERTRLNEILKEQNLTSVRPGEIPPAGQIRGCRYLCLGSITDFEIKKSSSNQGGGIFRGGLLRRITGVPALDINFSSTKLDFHIGVDVRIVDTTTGAVILAENADVKRNETAKGMGLNLVGFDVGKSGTVSVDSKNQGRLLRLALDEVVQKLIPQLDNMFSR